jgi:uncharacterized damage-inducible protein DinB
MSISESILPEFDHEMSNTRKSLERVPQDKFDWKPHPKSYSMAALATHIATLPTWVVYTLNETELDVAPPGQPPLKATPVASQQELMERFDDAVTRARAAIVEASDDQWMKTWTLLSGGNKVFSLPRIAVLRSFVMNHSIHHRAQLGVYLRLNDIPVPSIYGPTADEGTM